MSASQPAGEEAVRDDLRVLFVDNFDSFTYNLVEYVSEHAETEVVRNTASLEDVEAFEPDAIILSPGPGHPKNERDVGVTLEVLRAVSPDVPTLGVCLGLESAVYACGGTIGRAPKPIHGKAFPIDTTGRASSRDWNRGSRAGAITRSLQRTFPRSSSSARRRRPRTARNW